MGYTYIPIFIVTSLARVRCMEMENKLKCKQNAPKRRGIGWECRRSRPRPSSRKTKEETANLFEGEAIALNIHTNNTCTRFGY